MLPEISLNVLDVAENSVKAGATCVEIDVTVSAANSRLTIRIADNGCGMDAEQLAHVTDPFFTSRKTRKVGLGVPFFKQAAEITGGSFDIQSTPGVGTVVTAVFCTDSIDCMPVGNLNDTISSLVLMNETIRFVYRYTTDGSGFVLDTDEFHAELGPEVSFAEPEVTAFIREYLMMNTAEADEAAVSGSIE